MVTVETVVLVHDGGEALFGLLLGRAVLNSRKHGILIIEDVVRFLDRTTLKYSRLQVMKMTGVTLRIRL